MLRKMIWSTVHSYDSGLKKMSPQASFMQMLGPTLPSRWRLSHAVGKVRYNGLAYHFSEKEGVDLLLPTRRPTMKMRTELASEWRSQTTKNRCRLHGRPYPLALS